MNDESLEVKLARLDEKVDFVLKAIEELKSGTKDQINDHENRLKRLESTKTRQTVLISGGIAIMSFLATLMVYHILGK